MTEYSKGYKYFGGGARARHTLNAAYIQNAYRRHRRRRSARQDDMLNRVFELGRYAPYPNNMRRAFPIFMRRRENRERRWRQSVADAFPPAVEAITTARNGPNRLNPNAGRQGLPGHSNMPRVYDEHVDSLRGRQNQNPHWIGSRTNHSDPNITQQSMDDFMQRHGGPINQRTGERLRRDAEGRGVKFFDFLGNNK